MKSKEKGNVIIIGNRKPNADYFRLWIGPKGKCELENQDGEAMGFDEDKLFKLIEDFWKREF